MDPMHIMRSIYEYFDEPAPNFDPTTIHGIASFVVRPKRGLKYLLGEMRLGMITIFLVNVAIFKLLNIHLNHFKEKSYISTGLFIWAFSLNTLGFIPKIINYRNFHKARKIQEREALKMKMIEIFGKRIYKLSFDFAGTSIISHFITFVVSLKYFILTKHEYDVDLFLLIYSVLYQIRIIYSYKRYKKYFFRQDEEINPFDLIMYEYGNSDGRDHERRTDECSICWIEYQKKDQLGIYGCPGKHTFHLKCINNWLKRNYTCPICRKGLI